MLAKRVRIDKKILFPRCYSKSFFILRCCNYLLKACRCPLPVPFDILKSCPVKAFPKGKYSRNICRRQMNDDIENKVPAGEIGANGKRNLVVQYCRACELSCPVGA
jgi:hypothetical protein